jgi:hypothetical protein
VEIVGKSYGIDSIVPANNYTRASHVHNRARNLKAGININVETLLTTGGYA